MECIDKGDIIGALFLYNFSNSSLKWFDSYLHDRQQAMQGRNGLTEFSKILSGVPQGSILSPTLFPLFIYDLPLNFEICLSDLYADDATAHTNGKEVDTVEYKIQ